MTEQKDKNFENKQLMAGIIQFSKILLIAIDWNF